MIASSEGGASNSQCSARTVWIVHEGDAKSKYNNLISTAPSLGYVIIPASQLNQVDKMKRVWLARLQEFTF